MMKLILLAALCFVCYKTNPDEKSFKKFMEQKRKEKTSTTNSKVLNKVNNVISQAIAPLPHYTYTNYSLCSICSLDNGLIFIGICNSWYPLSALAGSQSNQEQSSAEVEKELEDYVTSGNKEKAQKNYNEAAKLYIKAAQGYEKQRNNYEAAINYENAFKAYQSDENYSRAYENAKTSARLFASNDRTLSRAARLYESMAQISKKQKDIKTAFENYSHAINLYNRMDGNNGGMQTRLAQANLAAEMGGSYADKAIELYEDIAKRSVDEPLLKYNVTSAIGKATLLNMDKFVSRDNIKAISGILGKYIDAYPAFENSAEYDLCHDIDLAFTNGDSEKVKNLCMKYKQTHNLSEWESEVIANVIKYADKMGFSIL